MATHKSYRARAAESFSSGLESPLEALGTRALREAEAELQRKAAELDDRDPAALEMLEEALAHEPRDAHERRAAARAYLGVTRSKSADAVETKSTTEDVYALADQLNSDLTEDWNAYAGAHILMDDGDEVDRASDAFLEMKRLIREIRDTAEDIDGSLELRGLARELESAANKGLDLYLVDALADVIGAEGEIRAGAIDELIAACEGVTADKSLSTLETKGTGYEEFRGCVGWLSAAIKGAEDMGADLGDAYDWVGEMFERTKYGPVSFTQDDVDTWSSQLDQIRSLLESALSEVEDEDETAKGKLPAQKRSLTEGLRQVDRAIEAIDDLEPDNEDEGKSLSGVDTKGGAKPSKTGMRWAEENEYDLEEIASYIEDAADAQEDRAREEWGPDSDDPDKEMVSMLRNDARDMRKLATAVRNGRLDDLEDLEPQDTAARDELPSEYYGLRDAWIDFQENGDEDDYEESAGAVETKGPRQYIVALDVGDLIDDGEVMRAIGALAEDNNGGTRGSMMSSSTEWSFETEEDAEAFCDQVNQEYASEGFEAHLYYGPDGYYKDADVDAVETKSTTEDVYALADQLNSDLTEDWNAYAYAHILMDDGDEVDKASSAFSEMKRCIREIRDTAEDIDGSLELRGLAKELASLADRGLDFYLVDAIAAEVGDIGSERAGAIDELIAACEGVTA